MREYIEEKISRIDYVNVVESERKVLFLNVFIYEKHSYILLIDFYNHHQHYQDRYYQYNILVLNKVLSTTTHAKEKKS